jgi:ribosome biogenesis GTPase A
MTETPSIQWFPGHMKKTERMIQKSLPLVDAVVEIFDARIAQSSRNPVLSKLIGNKPRLVLLNKADMADETVNLQWMSYFSSKGMSAVLTDCGSGKGVRNVVPALKKLLDTKLKRNIDKGMGGRTIHIMVVGIPNVGKSTLINKLAGKRKANVEDRPGVTREKQWVRISEECELLDIPGILWPKFDDPIVAERLAFTGAIKDTVIDIEALAARLIETLVPLYSENIKRRYEITLSESDNGYDILTNIAEKRGFRLRGGDFDTERAAIMILDEYRSKKIGRISLELPPNLNKTT